MRACIYGPIQRFMFMKLKSWILAARCKTLSASIAPVVMGGAIALGDDLFHFWSFFAALICALLIQIGTNFANDYHDFIKGADNNRVGPMRATASGLIKAEQMKIAYLIVFSCAALLGTYLVYRGGLIILAVGIISIICGILYTAGPFPLAYLGLGDVFVLLFFGPVAVLGTYYVQTLSFSSTALIAGFAPGLLSTGMLCINNLRDLQEDQRVGKKTLAVRWGSRFAKAQYVSAIVLAAAIPALVYQLTHSHGLIMWSSGILIFALPSFHVVCCSQDPRRLNKALANTGKLLILFGTTFSLGFSL